MKAQNILVLAALVAAVSSASAQSSVECRVGPGGEYQAALVWQNTLGVERANAICRHHALTLGLRTIEAAPAVVTQAAGATDTQTVAKAKPAAYAGHAQSRFDDDLKARAYASIGQGLKGTHAGSSAMPRSAKRQEAPMQAHTSLALSAVPDDSYVRMNEIAQAQDVAGPDNGYIRIR